MIVRLLFLYKAQNYNFSDDLYFYNITITFANVTQRGKYTKRYMRKSSCYTREVAPCCQESANTHCE